MKKLLKNLSYFLLPIIVLAFPADYLLSKKLRKSKSFAYGQSYVWNDIYSGNLNSEVLFYGSSRAATQIDPKLFEEKTGLNSYNLGLEGHNFWLSEFRHQEVLKYNKKPKHILLSLDTFSLEKRADLFNSEQFLPYFLFNDAISKGTSRYEGFSDSDSYVPLLRYVGKREAWKEVVFPEKDTFNFREKGFNPIDEIWNNDLNKAIENEGIYVVKMDPESIKKFQEFIADCKSKNIDLILVYTPEYIEGQKFVSERQKIMAFYETIANQNNILFLDYSNDSISMDKKYFVNSQHLNRTGATSFTKKLAHDLKNHFSKK